MRMDHNQPYYTTLLQENISTKGSSSFARRLCLVCLSAYVMAIAAALTQSVIPSTETPEEVTITSSCCATLLLFSAVYRCLTSSGYTLRTDEAIVLLVESGKHISRMTADIIGVTAVLLLSQCYCWGVTRHPGVDKNHMGDRCTRRTRRTCSHYPMAILLAPSVCGNTDAVACARGPQDMCARCCVWWFDHLLRLLRDDGARVCGSYTLMLLACYALLR
jgi:hypothetical protein